MDAYIEQKVRTMTTTDTYLWVTLPISYSNTDYFTITLSNENKDSLDDYEVGAGIHQTTPSGHTSCKEINGFSIRVQGSRSRYRDSFTYGY